MANISKIKVGDTSYGITATPTAHASTATTYGAASASKYGHVKLSDNYASSAGAAASGVGASSLAVYNAYNTLNSNLTLIKTEMNDMRHLGSLEITNATANHTISNISGYKTLIFTGFDGDGVNHLDSMSMPVSAFKQGIGVTVYAHALQNYYATILIKYVNDTTITCVPRELVGWQAVGIRVYGLI